MQTTVERLTYTTAEAAQVLGISERTAWELVHSGRIPSIRISARRIIISKKAIGKILEEGLPVA